MQNFFIRLKVMLHSPNIDVSQKNQLWCVATRMSGKQRHSKCSKWPPSARIHASSFFWHWSTATLCWKSAHVATRRFRNSSVSRIGTRYVCSCSMPRRAYLLGWAQDCWLATCQDWWTGVSHGTEARLCHEHDVLAHCLAGIQTRLQQCYGSLIAASASATHLGNTSRWVLLQAQLNEDNIGTAEFGYCKSPCIEYQSAIRTTCGSVLLRHITWAEFQHSIDR